MTVHNCINLRLPTHGGVYAWEFEKAGSELKVRVDGQLVVGTASLILTAALEGFGLAYLPEDTVRPHLAAGRLVRVLSDGACLFRVIISITRADDISPRPSP